MPTTRSLVTSESDMAVWVRDANPGDRCCYHSGELSIDVDAEHTALPADRAAELLNLGRYAYELCQAGCVFLMQSREGTVFDYLAVRSSHMDAGRMPSPLASALVSQ